MLRFKKSYAALGEVRWACNEYSPGKSDPPISSCMEEVRLWIGNGRSQPPWPHSLAEGRLMSHNGLWVEGTSTYSSVSPTENRGICPQPVPW